MKKTIRKLHCITKTRPFVRTNASMTTKTFSALDFVSKLKNLLICLYNYIEDCRLLHHTCILLQTMQFIAYY